MSSSEISFDIIHSLPPRAHSSSYSSERIMSSRGRHKPTPSEYISMFTGFFVVEFDLEDGEVVIFKQVSTELNSGVEKELVRVLMGCDYSADANSFENSKEEHHEKQNLILTHSIMNFHCISVHFSVYNPSNRRGYVSTVCMSLLQSRQFSCQQAKFIKEELQKSSKFLQETSFSYWNGTTQTFDSPLQFTPLLNTALQQANGVYSTFLQLSKTLMTSHTNTSYDCYFSNITTPSNVITLGNFALCNSSFDKPIEHQFPFPAIFPLYKAPQRLLNQQKFTFRTMYEMMPKVFPHLILTILSGCRITIYNSTLQTTVKQLKEIGEFLTSLCIGGVSTAHYLPQIDEDKALNGQILISSSNTYIGNDASWDLAKGFKGLFYEGKSLLDEFITYIKEDGQFIEERYWNVVLDYWGLTIRCLSGEQIPKSQEKYIIENFIRRIEIEREAPSRAILHPSAPLRSA